MTHKIIRDIRRGSLLILLALAAQFGNAFADEKLDNIKPALLKGSEYNEYWLQYFLFEDGSYLTTQFSIVNFPFNKHKAIMLSTLITPDGKRYIIQNGRGRSDWTFDPERLNITFSRDINHNVQGAFPDYKMTVHNTMAEANLTLKSTLPPLEHDVYSPKKNKKMAVSLYAPHFEATGKWRLGEEAGAPVDSPWNDFGKGEGFGLHVLMNGPIDKLMNSWLRVFGLKGDGGEKIILSSIERPDGKRDNELILHNGGTLTTFSEIEVGVIEQQPNGKKDFPKVIYLKANNDEGILEGTITFAKKLQHFRLQEHVSTLERLILSAFPTFTRYHYVADYNLLYTTAEGSKKITGKALSEYNQVDSATRPKKKRRRHR